MSKTYIILPDPHAHFQNNNERAGLVARLILDIKPDCFLCLGDLADMPSLSGYDRGKKTFMGRTYMADIESALDFNDRLWAPVRASKKRLPHRVILEGNHEERISRAINLQPELEGAISFDDLCYHEYYDEVIRYDGSTPGIYAQDGIAFAHYMVSGIAGRAISGEHIGYSLVTKRFGSSVVGHNHLLDYCQRTDNHGQRIIGLSVGCFLDYEADWCGNTQDLWWRGVIVLRNVSNGQFDTEFISLNRLKEEYT